MVTSMAARHALGRAGLDIALRPAVLLARPRGWGGVGGCARVRCLHVSSVLLRSPPMIRFRYGNNKGGSARRLAPPTPASPWLSALPLLPFCTVASLFPHPRGAGGGFRADGLRAPLRLARSGGFSRADCLKAEEKEGRSGGSGGDRRRHVVHGCSRQCRCVGLR
eukprot:COSAG01_NODE_6050_length_3880_cov_4.660970_3_plen_165_part_00